MTKLLVIGGTGFIGMNLIDRAIRSGFDVYSISNGPISSPISGANYYTGGIRSVLDSKEDFLNLNFDYLVHSGGYVDHRRFSDGGIEVISSHFIDFIELVRRLKIRDIKKIVSIGSSDEYGNTQAEKTESLRECVSSCYSFSKLALTQFLQMLYRSEGVPTVSLRLFLTYGPGQNIQRFIPQGIRGCLNNQDFPVSQGLQVRDFIYIDDVVEAIFRCFSKKEADGKVLNLGSGRGLQVRKVVQMINEKIEGGRPIFGAIGTRQNEAPHLVANIDLLSKSLDWVPEIAFEKGIDLTISSYR